MNMNIKGFIEEYPFILQRANFWDLKSYLIYPQPTLVCFLRCNCERIELYSKKDLVCTVRDEYFYRNLILFRYELKILETFPKCMITKDFGPK